MNSISLFSYKALARIHNHGLSSLNEDLKAFMSRNIAAAHSTRRWKSDTFNFSLRDSETTRILLLPPSGYFFFFEKRFLPPLLSIQAQERKGAIDVKMRRCCLSIQSQRLNSRIEENMTESLLLLEEEEKIIGVNCRVLYVNCRNQFA